ncbi:MAG: Crp/Fnr family transcriptional regulator [Clostridia bacterium]|nr:Crp/Fnr family transcriptional regulator [Clostridia bacterium]
MAENLHYLENLPIFSGLSQKDLELIEHIIINRKYTKHHIIFLEGEPGDGLYFVKSGRVKVYKSTEDGRERILHFLREGDIFAEVLLFDKGPFPATAEAMEDCEIGVIPSADMSHLLIQHPQIALKMLKMMSARLRMAQVELSTFAYRDTYSRMAALLLQLANDLGTKTDEGTVINLAVTQRELASRIGVSRETVTRILTEFKREGILTFNRQKIVLSDLTKLRQKSKTGS